MHPQRNPSCRASSAPQIGIVHAPVAAAAAPPEALKVLGRASLPCNDLPCTAKSSDRHGAPATTPWDMQSIPTRRPERAPSNGIPHEGTAAAVGEILG